MRMLMIFVTALCMTLSLSACERNAVEDASVIPTVPGNIPENNEDNTNTDNEMVRKMKITVGDHVLTATLEDNATTRALALRLPMTLPMMDLYGREMCYRFPEALPTDNARTRGYEVGEIVYYPPMHSFVIMYRQNGEHFQMQSIGRIDSGVDVFDGIGDVDVRFERAE